MNREFPIALVDTNVWLDNYLGQRPHAKESRQFIDTARQCGVQLAYAIHALHDFFYIVQIELKRSSPTEGPATQSEVLAAREAAWACVESLRGMATAIGADESDAWRACKYRALNNDLEDNFVLAAAERVPVDFLVTNDFDLIQKSTVNAYTPANATLMLQATRL